MNTQSTTPVAVDAVPRPHRGSRSRRTVAAVGAALAVLGAPLAAAGPANAIIGGNPAERSSYPYFAEVNGNGSLCGGSVIASEWVLTAAHCVDNLDRTQVTVRLKGQTFAAFSLVVHPLWNGKESDGHDLAAVWVSAAATAGIAPVKVGAPADPGAYAAGNEATVVGLGRTSASSSSSAGSFHELKTVLRTDSHMDDVYNKWYWFDHWDGGMMIGAGFTNHTVCYGDSGGPLTVQRNGSTVQVGVASFVQTWPSECAQPGGFARLEGAHLAWLGTIVRSIREGWGPCTTAHGSAGKYVAFYGYGPQYPHRDGRNSWKIECMRPGVPGTTTTTTPGPRPPAGTVCEKKPWTPGCENYEGPA